MRKLATIIITLLFGLAPLACDKQDDKKADGKDDKKADGKDDKKDDKAAAKDGEEKKADGGGW